ncbi:MAG TPA: GtrA family protein [Fibrobacteraceae bacterium]|nr:GtrA family protein [Fibrobacteraceae bacterium]
MMVHFFKYNAIGLLNTGITLMVVWVLHQVLDVSVVLANFLGYVAGGVNSYLCNRIWNFKSQNAHGREILRFLVVFAFSYFLNLGVLLGSEWCLLHWPPVAGFAHWSAQWFKPGYVAHVMANIVYVLTSFSLYKVWVFRKTSRLPCTEQDISR